jgi:hypothetical protein
VAAHNRPAVEAQSEKEIDMRTIRFLVALLILAVSAAAFAQIGVAIAIGPPALPVYEQPICPGDGYLWTPGYWAWDDADSDYYWVPGTWVLAPEVGFLWTPGYWGWREGGFFWNEGFWGPTVGFYGGISYGFGYFGHGFVGGRWNHDHFFYNRAVMNVDVTVVHNVYNTRVENITNVNRVSYNGGNGGIVARPSHEEEAAARERHIPPVAAQMEHASAARSNPEMRAKANHGDPPVKATARPGDFSRRPAAVKESGEPARSEPGSTGEPRAAVHPNELPPIAHPEPANSGDPKADQKFQKQQEKLNAKQEQERQSLQQKQEAEHQKQMSDAQKQKLEQKHQQQTQKLAQKHTEEQRSLQSRQPQPKPRR